MAENTKVKMRFLYKSEKENEHDARFSLESNKFWL